MKNILLVIAVLLYVNISIAQNSSPGFYTFVSIGGGFTGESQLISTSYVARGFKFIPYNPKLSGKFGIGYNSIAHLSDIKFSASIEAGYFSCSTNNSNHSPSQAQAEQKVIPITINLTISNEGKFSPFLKVGLGIENKIYEETYENRPDYNVKADKWFMVITGGGGLKYNLNEKFNIALLFEMAFIDGKLYADNKYGWNTEYDGIQLNSYAGLQFGYSF